MLRVLKVLRVRVLTVLMVLGAPAYAQSPNTATIVVLVTDQTGGVVLDATVAAMNVQTGLRREARTGSAGSATIPALPLTGTYIVSVSKPGFATQDDARDLILRAGETATLKVKLLVGTEKAEVTVCGSD